MPTLVGVQPFRSSRFSEGFKNLRLEISGSVEPELALLRCYGKRKNSVIENLTELIRGHG